MALYRLFVSDSWMLLATLGTLMLIAVMATSIRAARKRFRYESWHLIHLYSYLGLVLAFPHQVFTGPHFHQGWTQFFWWAMMCAAFGATLGFRVLLPVWRTRRHRLRVSETRDEAPGVRAITMTGRALSDLRVKPGQFFVWRFMGGHGWTRGHPYTVSASLSDGSLRITVQAVGDGSARDAAIEPGTAVAIEGPYGAMDESSRRCPEMVMIAAGVGVAPFVGMLQDWDYRPSEATVIYRISKTEDAIHLKELQDLARIRGFVLHVIAGHRRPRSWFPDDMPHETDAEALLSLAPHISRSDAFICGPAKWNRLVRGTLKAVGVSRRNIHAERFIW